VLKFNNEIKTFLFFEFTHGLIFFNFLKNVDYFSISHFYMQVILLIHMFIILFNVFLIISLIIIYFSSFLLIVKL
jgi:hypothetical protein